MTSESGTQTNGEYWVPRYTTDVYAQLQHRIERRHGPEFDRLVRQAAEQMVSPPGATAMNTVEVPGKDDARLLVGGLA